MLDSLLNQLNGLGVRLSLKGEELQISAPTGSLNDTLRDALKLNRDALLAMLKSARTESVEAPVVLEHDEARRWQPFPLTELQHAYWLGRDPRIEMGGVATHLYVELDCPSVDMTRLGVALNQLIEQQDMLRAVLDGQGQQAVQAVVPPYVIATKDCRAMDANLAEAACRQTRQALSHEVRDPQVWPLFEVQATLVPEGKTRLHISLDLLLFDAWSLSLFFKGWHALYEQPAAKQPLSVTFRDYVLMEARQRDSADYRQAQAYWEARIDSIPPAPELPLRLDPLARRKPFFTRHETRLDRAQWQRLKAQAREHGLTPSGVLLAAYSEVLARWSASQHFTVAVTTGRREPWHPDVQRMIGDFTSVVLTEVDRSAASDSFLVFALGVQKQLMRDLSHSAYSGVTVRREWTKRRMRPLEAAMPVVFSSALARDGGQEVGDLEQFGTKVHAISQTSQVWLDHHVTEQHGDLLLNWDVAEAVFEPGVVQAMFATYSHLIERLADNPELWQSTNVLALPVEMERKRHPLNPNHSPQLLEPIHAPIVRHALASPQAIAVQSTDRTLTYGELLSEASAVADWLLAAGLAPEQHVAVIMEKGWGQVVAVLGVLLAKGAYVPIDPALPVKRQRQLLQLSTVQHLLTLPGQLHTEVLEGPWSVLNLTVGQNAPYGKHHEQSLSSDGLPRLAYTIFTSGTTGVPKGVMIDHAAASNTITDINALLAVKPEDCLLGVSSLSFDLSVYDIFGILGAGATLVLPAPRRGHDPQHWKALMDAHRVTLWNSAPQLMQMLTDSLDRQPQGLTSLRAIMMSGDFIPVELPMRIRALGCDGLILSLGGATEAAIWSIAHPIGKVDDAHSIPYGRALANQRVTVLDRALRPTPDHVQGRIYISGAGLARGYLGDDEKTAQRFFPHPICGERLYDTGDLGRYNDLGEIVILGRDDSQVKIRGHRVELGEIETVIGRHPDVAQAVIVAALSHADTKRLIAYVQPRTQATELTTQAIRSFVDEHLPDYMVPQHVVFLAQLPVSTNGKVDYQALPAVTEGFDDDGLSQVEPRTESEAIILGVWQRLIPGLTIGVTNNFFELGGDSVLATRLVHELNESLQMNLEIQDLFENLTIEDLARLRDERAASTGSTRSGLSHGKANAQTLNADVARLGAKAGLHLARQPSTVSNEDGDQRGAVLVTGATGWVGAHLLAELLRSSERQVVCLVRGDTDAAARHRLLERLDELGLDLSSTQLARLMVVSADMSAPSLGLPMWRWLALTESVTHVHHLSGSVSLAQGYESLMRDNVEPLAELLRFAVEGRPKALFTLSPMTVCRRRLAHGLEVLTEEDIHPSSDGLLTAYAQSKWVAEQVLAAASAAGARVRIYRCSHALASTATGMAKPSDTYTAVLRAAASVSALPDWPTAHIHGVPVDILCRCIVADSLNAPGTALVVHLEHSAPTPFNTVLTALHGGQSFGNEVALSTWKRLCVNASHALPAPLAQLAGSLFEPREDGTSAIDNMFSEHRFSTRHLDMNGWAEPLSRALDASYWRRVLDSTATDACPV